MKHGLAPIFQEAQDRSYPKGQIILYQGEKTHETFYIQSGYIKVYDVTAQGTEKLVLILGPGDVFPLLWTFREVENLHYFYESLSDIELKVIESSVFIEKIKKDHNSTLNMLQYFVNTTKDLMSRIDCIEAASAKRKIAQVIYYLATAHGVPTSKNIYKITLPITHQIIANMAGVSRETASIHLKELEEEKLFDIIDTVILARINRIDAFLESV